MKNSNKMFILTEIVLGVLVVILGVIMLSEKIEKDVDKVSVIVQNSDDNQWTAFKYGLKMAAKDYGVEMFVVSTKSVMTVEEERNVIQQEIDNGADAVIVQPVAEESVEKMLQKIEKKVPVILVQTTASKEREASRLSTVEPDNYAMGKALAEELLKDYNGNISGKTLGIVSETNATEASTNREKGFQDALKGTGVIVSWTVAGFFPENDTSVLEEQSKVDIVAALDDNSLIMSGKCAAANNLRGAVVYGIGTSTEAAYYLDTGIVECLMVPDEFNVGYQSLAEAVKNLKNGVHRKKNQEVSYTIIRKEALFSKENQEILFTMSQ